MIKKFLKQIFKKITYTFFKSIHGKIKNSITSSESESIKVKNINVEENLNYKVYKIDNGRLYTDRIHDTAVIIDNKIIKGPSFQWRWSNEPKLYNSNIKNNIVFTKGTPRRLKKLNGTVLSLLTGGGANKNYWHWLFDSLPRIDLCEKTFGLSKIDYFLLQNHVKKFQIETLDCLNIPRNKRLSSEKFRHIKASELIITDHPFIISDKATDDSMNVPGWISVWLKKNFLKKIIPTNKNAKKIYIDRSDKTVDTTPQRYIINEDEVKDYLLKKNFVSVKLHEINFIEQVNLFNNAEIIAGLHGGGFANLAFCRPGTKVIELKTPESGPPIENLAKKNSLNYKAVTIKAKKNTEELNFIHQHGAIEVPIEKLSNVLED